MKISLMDHQSGFHNSRFSNLIGLATSIGTAGRQVVWLISILAVVAGLGLSPSEGLAKNKQKFPPRLEPELKILELKITPNPYVLGQGPLQFAVTVQLPKELDQAAVLEVSSLVSLPSKTSLRFLSDRKPVQTFLNGTPEPSAEAVTGESAPQDNPLPLPLRLQVILIWDGNDQHQRVAQAGAYDYEVRAKLLTMGEKGARTQMVSWPRRGTLVVK